MRRKTTNRINDICLTVVGITVGLMGVAGAVISTILFFGVVALIVFTLMLMGG